MKRVNVLQLDIQKDPLQLIIWVHSIQAKVEMI